ncbi:hypothetical protein BGZ52_008639 [Haplosporangium bisporale]|nr:hypothetical protein BGZ52_008639 [Haplosporangium bisporale]
MATDIKVIIAGAGLGGLSAAISLELAGIDYIVLEPASDSKGDIGGAVQVSPTAMHFLHQLGIYEEIQKISKPVSGYSMNEHDMNYVGRIDVSPFKERYGYHTEVMARSQLHALLFQRVPPKRFVTGKVLGMIQGRDKVTVRCSDGSTHEGDILIAADGAFSNIRHTLYWSLDEKKRLPKTDTINMSVDLHVISGCTKPLDPEKFPVLLDTMSEIQSVQLPGKPYTIWFMPLLDNRIAWDIARDVPKTSIRQGESSKVNIWRPEDIEEVLNAVKDYDCPYGGKIGDLLDTTPPEQMYMYMSEERCWETWFGGRTVLLGDACHKGFYQPASEAILDAVTLANLLSTLQDDTHESIAAVFNEYRDRRAPLAKAAVEQSALFRQVFSGKGRAASLKRNLVFNYMPDKVRHMLDDKRHENRPQLWFLPQVKDCGIARPVPNLPSSSSSDTATTITASNSTLVASSSSTSTSESRGSTVSRTSSSTSSPRTSRTSWSSVMSRPAFTMPSAPNVPLFSTKMPSQVVVKKVEPQVSIGDADKRSSTGSSDSGIDSLKSSCTLITATEVPSEVTPVPSIEEANQVEKSDDNEKQLTEVVTKDQTTDKVNEQAVAV